MSRSTQFIGLTNEAAEYVKNLKELPSDTFTHGMFDEKIELRKWEIPKEFMSSERPNACIREVVQASPWSSGPMIFTCLTLHFGNCIPEHNGMNILQWVDDPRVKGEVDQENGKFWV
jgi:hypothetical protein